MRKLGQRHGPELKSVKAAHSVGALKRTGQQKETKSRGPGVPLSDKPAASPTSVQIWLQLILLIV